MNKRALKRLKETIEKERVDRTKGHQEPKFPAPKDPTKLPGFLPKPEKKRG